MTIEQALTKVLGFGPKVFIEKAIAGGYSAVWNDALQGVFHPMRLEITIHEILLDPLAWKAVGKVEKENGRGFNLEAMAHGVTPTTQEYDWDWRGNMHRLIDALCETV